MTFNLLKNLPQEIQNEIFMYNCEHRPLMKMLLIDMGNHICFHKGQKAYWENQFRYTMRMYNEYGISCICCGGYKPISLINTRFCSSKCEIDDYFMNP